MKMNMKLFGFKHEKHYMGANEAQSLFLYGFKNITIEEAVSREVDELETNIKVRSGAGYRIATKVFQDWKKDLAEKLRDHFTEKGFVTDLYENPKIPNTILLIIGW